MVDEALPLPPPPDLSRAILALAAGSAAATAAGLVVFGGLGSHGPVVLRPLPWVMPAAHSFITLSSVALATLCWARHRAVGGAWLFWTGAVFLATSGLGIFYILSWPGLVGEAGVIARSPNTSGWLGMAYAALMALLLPALRAREPERFRRSFGARVYAAAFLLPCAFATACVRFEDFLPIVIAAGGAITRPAACAVALFDSITIAAAVAAWRRYREEKDFVLGCLTLFLVQFTFGVLHTVIGGTRYGGWWYFGRLEMVAATVILLLGFVQEGYALYRDARAQAEDRGRLIRELDGANRGLESFSYAVAHDLQAPLRHIMRFCGVLEEENAAGLGEAGRGRLRAIRNEGRKMARLLEDLLELSRCTTGPMLREDADLSALASDIAQGLRAEEAGRGVDFAIEAGVRADADPGLVAVLLTNLLGNAWKFTRMKDRARIEFGVDDAHGERAYFVRDDGAGFDMARVDTLFEPFHRLHDVKTFPGSGVGLSTAKRIVERHDGRIWARSEPGRGAVFYFTLGEP
jgi:signal transduction histidine kinase